MKTDRRRQLLVNPSLQIYLLLNAGLFALILVVGVLLADYMYESSISQMLDSLKTSSEAALVVESIYRARSLKSILIFSISSAFLVAWLAQAYVISIRIAGPIFKTTRYLNEVAEQGKKPGLSFRKKDFYHELAQAVNKAIPPEKPPQNT